LSEVLSLKGATRYGETGRAFSAFFADFRADQGLAGGFAGGAASLAGVRSDGSRFDGLGLSGEVCVWTIFHAVPTFW
jgi:hypothetical protein